MAMFGKYARYHNLLHGALLANFCLSCLTRALGSEKEV
jgi:hypothetical protein